jgi:hypothetical protein
MVGGVRLSIDEGASLKTNCCRAAIVGLAMIMAATLFPSAALAAVNPVPDPGGLWRPPPGAVPEGVTSVYLQSDTGDYIGQGDELLYTRMDAVLDVSHVAGEVTVRVEGDEHWTGQFRGPLVVDPLQVGYYQDLTRLPFDDRTVGGLSWTGEGRGCNQVVGWFVVDHVAMVAGQLDELTMRFAQHCEGGAAALRGQIVYDAADQTQPAGPVFPPPSNLWTAPEDAMPSTGTAVYLQGTPNDYVGQGHSYLYTKAGATITASHAAGLINVRVEGDESWMMSFKAMDVLQSLQLGYYGELKRYPFHNPTRGGLSWSGEGRGCNELTGWFAIDDLELVANVLERVVVRFEQSCGGGPPAHGRIVYDAADTTTPPGPTPVPPGLWRPDPTNLPVSGSYVWLESEPGDWVGKGRESLYQPDDGLVVSPGTNFIGVSINGTDRWNGSFAAMNSLASLSTGLYADLQRYPFHNPTKGGLSWSGNGAGCNKLSGWFAIDDLAVQHGSVRSFTLRFEQHCESPAAPALHGLIHWEAGGGSGPMCDGSFTDVTLANPFCGVIGWASSERIVTGYTDGTFRPGTAATRGAAVATLYRLAGSPAGPYPGVSFSDVPPSHPFRTAMEWAAATGVVSGFADGTFRSGSLVNREALVAWLHRLAGSPPGPFPDPLFSDVPGNSPFKPAIDWSADVGVSQGLPDGTFEPTKPVTRQAVAAFLHRFDGVWKPGL